MLHGKKLIDLDINDIRTALYVSNQLYLECRGSLDSWAELQEKD